MKILVRQISLNKFINKDDYVIDILINKLMILFKLSTVNLVICLLVIYVLIHMLTINVNYTVNLKDNIPTLDEI